MAAKVSRVARMHRHTLMWILLILLAAIIVVLVVICAARSRRSARHCRRSHRRRGRHGSRAASPGDVRPVDTAASTSAAGTTSAFGSAGSAGSASAASARASAAAAAATAAARRRRAGAGGGGTGGAGGGGGGAPTSSTAPLYTAGAGGKVPGSFIVRYKSAKVDAHEAAADAVHSVMAPHGASVTHRYSAAFPGCAVEKVTTPAGLSALRAHPLVSEVFEDAIVRTSSLPPTTPPEPVTHMPVDSPLPSSASSTSSAGIHAKSTPTLVLPWEVTREGAPLGSLHLSGATTPTAVNATIAIIDTGLDLKNVNLNVVSGVTFVSGTTSAQDQNGHGTHVAGIAAGKGVLYTTSGNVRLVGVCPGAKLLAVRVLDASGSGSFSSVIAGVNYVAAYQRLHPTTPIVANMSLGADVESSAMNPLDDAVAGAMAAGVFFAIAAGNSSGSASLFSPAHTPGALAVGSYGRTGRFSTSFSNFGPVVGILAGGENVVSTWIGGSAATLTGSSMSTPSVAGIAALYRKLHPTASVAAVRAALIAAAAPSSSNPAITSCPSGTTTRSVWEGAF